jgi:hypothetical protein
MAQMRVLTSTIFAVGLSLGLTGCGVTFATLPAGTVAGRIKSWDYSPSVIQSGNLQQLWWCGSAYNPSHTAQFSDTIQYESIDLSTNVHSEPLAVLGETQGAWDSAYTCNPKVVKGSFTNPLGNGESFTYAMYYVGTSSAQGLNNSIGVAFSNDGMSWKKYPQPIITPETQEGYGVAQPAVYNNDHHQAIRMFYEDDSFATHHIEAVSADGVHFATQGTLAANGLFAGTLTWGDMAYDPDSGYWYAGFNTPLRVPLTTGGEIELGPYGIILCRIRDASLLTGATPWEFLETIDTNLTGYESNFLPGFVRDSFGNLVSGPSIKMLTSISAPAPGWNASPAAAAYSASVINWKISSAAWTAEQPLMALNRYFNQTTHEVTTGWIDPNGGFSLQATLGHLYPVPQQGATVPFFACKTLSTDYFVSLDDGCEGARILGVNGYGYSKPVAGLNLVAIYRCASSKDHFVSTDPKCEGQQAQKLLGYILP